MSNPVPSPLYFPDRKIQREALLESPEIKGALRVVHALRSGDYVAFFRAFREQGVMHRCLMAQYVGSMRTTAIKVRECNMGGRSVAVLESLGGRCERADFISRFERLCNFGRDALVLSCFGCLRAVVPHRGSLSHLLCCRYVCAFLSLRSSVSVTSICPLGR